MLTFVCALHQKIRNCATMSSPRLCPMHATKINLMRFCVIGVRSTAAIRGSGGIVSSFRLICIAALTVAMAGFVAGAAVAQSAIATDQSGKPYLAGLHPPHEQRKPAHATSHVSAQRKATTKMARPETKRRPIVGANSKPHRPAHLAEKINSGVAWPSAEPAATDERASSQTVLQFATEDSEPTPAAAPRPTIPASAPSTAKTAPPAKIAATDERNSVDSTPVDKPSPTASTPVQTERFEAPASNQMRVIVPAPIETPVTTSTLQDQPPARSSSSTAQILATLAGAITAGIVGWLIFGFGSFRTIKPREF
jgi:hypothetical protein